MLIGYARRGRLTGVVRSGLRGFWLIFAAFALESSTGLLARWFPDIFLSIYGWKFFYSTRCSSHLYC
jgi:hypothetical protein